MNIAVSILDALKALATRRGARFSLNHRSDNSGYFVARHSSRSPTPIGGSAQPPFGTNFTPRNCRTETFPRAESLYHLFSRRLYRQSTARTSATADNTKSSTSATHWNPRFCAFQPQDEYLETEPAKGHLFCDQLKAPHTFCPQRCITVQRTSQPTLRYFVDKFPMVSLR